MYLVPGLIDHCNEKLSDFLIKIRQEILSFVYFLFVKNITYLQDERSRWMRYSAYI
jgi:hypothetical protein